MLDTIPVHSAFARRRREAWSNLRWKCAPIIVTRADLQVPFLARPLAHEDVQGTGTLVTMC